MFVKYFMPLVKKGFRMKILPFLFTIAFCSAVSANTYFVAPPDSKPAGNDLNPGTINQPWGTWQKAFKTAIAGDTVFFRGGIWYPSIYGYLKIWPEEGIGHSGTRSKPIHYFNYPGETPILDCRNLKPQYGNMNPGIDILRASFLHFKGLTVRNLYGRSNPILAVAINANECANLTFENMIVHDISGRGYFYMSGAWRTGENGGDIAPFPNQTDTLRFINCDAYNLCDTVSDDPGNAADGWWCAGYRDGYFSWYGCRAWYYTDDGIDSFGSQTRVLDHCWVMGTRKYIGIDIESGFEGNGMKMAGCLYKPDENEHKVIIRNCIAAYCNANATVNNAGSIGFYTNLYSGANGNYQQNCLLYNNTAYSCNVGFQDLVTGGETRTSVFRNNISAYSTSSGYGYDPLYEVSIAYPSIYKESNNSWRATQVSGDASWPGWTYNPTVTVTNADFVSVDSSQIRLPRKPDGSLPDISFLSLAEGSDLIDAGINVGLPYYGSAPDIGHSEYLSGSITATNPVYVRSVIENSTPSRLEMTYNLSLANIVPAASAFTVSVNASVRIISAVAISGTKVLLTLNNPVVYGDIVTIAYTKPASNPLQTSAGAQAASLTSSNVTNNVAVVNPVYVSSVIENSTPSILEMTYNLSLANIVPAASAFTVTVNSSVRTVSTVAISGNKVLLTLASPIVYGNVVTVAYTKPATNQLQTSAGGQAASIFGKSVINNCALTENRPPIVSLTSPTKSISFTEPTNITIEASTSDPDGSVSKVEFYNGNTKLGETSSPPYTYIWKNVTHGYYILTAVAIDNLNARTTSDATNVVVEKSISIINQLPVIQITTSNNQKKYKKNEKIILKASASDPDGTIDYVEFRNEDVILAKVQSEPYNFNMQFSDTGNYIVTAVAFDNLGGESSASVEIMIVQTEMTEIRLYPNPNDGRFSIDLTSATTNSEIAILNSSGNVIYNGYIDYEEYLKQFDLLESKPGIYILILKKKGKMIAVQKYIKK